jgi:hypothetical protein
MMAMSKQMLEQEPGDIEALLPWHVAGTLSARDARRVEEALARDPTLARLHAAIRDEYAATIQLNERLGAPSSRAMKKLFAAIDAEPSQARSVGPGWAARLAGVLAGLSPRMLALSGGLAALLLLLQAGVIGALLFKSDAGRFDLASAQRMSEQWQNEPLTRGIGAQNAPRAIVQFTPDARASDIAALLDAYRATIIESRRGGLFRLQLGDQPISQWQMADLIARLQNEKIVSAVSAAP